MSGQATTKVTVGALLLLVGSVIVLGMLGNFTPGLPRSLSAISMLAMAAGALLVGVSGESGRPV